AERVIVCCQRRRVWRFYLIRVSSRPFLSWFSAAREVQQSWYPRLSNCWGPTVRRDCYRNPSERTTWTLPGPQSNGSTKVRIQIGGGEKILAKKPGSRNEGGPTLDDFEPVPEGRFRAGGGVTPPARLSEQTLTQAGLSPASSETPPP